ncbi:MAG: protein-disulfide reductase DsbD [Candidatus Competibacteraceae bacterium]|nr:protein-disulfide reductase DsbD [Candidatus Competibacteraceae bacterium]MBK8964577.1 protein-disulfide reductase DsbD [Candidatus Competibacteraceae bacterium]
MRRSQRPWPWLPIVLLALLAGPATGGLFDRFGSASRERVLSADQAFQLTVNPLDASLIEARWIIAPDYYLYRDKFQLSLPDAQGVGITALEVPSGEPKDDPYFGRQEVFHNEAVIVARLRRDSANEQTVRIKADYQGCAEIGVCYPPLSQIVTVNLPTSRPQPTASPLATEPRADPAAATAQAAQAVVRVENSNIAPPAVPPPFTQTGPRLASNEPEQDRLARLLSEQRFWAIPAFFGFGLLLAFTPCVFPMIPILSGLIVGQGARLTRQKAILLSLIYVLAMACAYTIVGLLAALLGQNIQAWFQNPWVVGLFSGLFILLALSMFGLYDLQLPAYLQNRLVDWSNRQRGGHYLGVAVMGLLSALIVGPCVAPPLIGALTFITVTGDLLLGGVALFALSLGMGLPLLLIGASTGHWLPHAGHWMERIKLVFGVLLLAVAIWLLERILPAAVVMVLWATLLIMTATYMGALQPLIQGAPAWRSLVKGLGLVLLVYGVLLLVGVAAGGRDPWQPLRGASFITHTTHQLPAPLFRPIKTVADVDEALQATAGRPALLDFYADWCASCKEMERYTFSDPDVLATLTAIVVLRADVTANDAADRDLLKRFGVVGPPALLFFGPDGGERRDHRVVGFIEADAFNKHLQSMLGQGG